MTAPTATVLLKLRPNIALPGDLWLARHELELLLGCAVEPVPDLAALASEIPSLAVWQGPASPAAQPRPIAPQGFRVVAPLPALVALARRATFVQDVYAVAPDTSAHAALVRQAADRLGPTLAWKRLPGELAVHLVTHQALCEVSDWAVRHATGPADTVALLGQILSAWMDQNPDPHAQRLAAQALAARSASSYLSHDVHNYKAKFFPRLARALINICAAGDDDHPPRVLDPFCGSGTTLLEASAVGMDAQGVDVDPLSVLISQAKLAALQLDGDLLAQEAHRALERLQGAGASSTALDTAAGPSRAAPASPSGRAPAGPSDPELAGPPLRFPPWLLKNRKMSAYLVDSLTREIRHARATVAGCDPHVRPLFHTLLSDAVSRRVRLRFLGTGVGRFSLTFSRASVGEMLSRSVQRYANVVAAGGWLRQTLNMAWGSATAARGDARCLPHPAGQFDILVTSPPYLPAASGRESYARARALSLIALGMAAAEDVDDLAGSSIGAMDPSDVDLGQLTPAEGRLVSWLAQDPLRQPKAGPTARYFLEMRRALAEMHRVLAPGGRCALVSGRQSTFYRFSTRQVLQVAHSAEYLAEESLRAGFDIRATHDLQLAKGNLNARPRSLDDYYETIIIMVKPG